ncbi:MAG: hypothetical protein GY810_28450 [Aureispira sp.]|nr:hypothetical protein [Aureispira sp.]
MMYFKLLGSLTVLGACLAGYFYVSGLQNEVVSLEKSNTKYELVVNELSSNMAAIVADIENNKARLIEFDNNVKANAKEVDDLRTKMSRHDLNKILQGSPKRFEKIIQKGTDDYYKELVEVSKWEDQ